MTEWTAGRFLSWAGDIDGDVKIYIQKVLDHKPHPAQGYKSCLGILSFAKKVGNERLIHACRALGYGSYSFKAIERILTKGLDAQTESDESGQLSMPLHDNIRGENYYK